MESSLRALDLALNCELTDPPGRVGAWAQADLLLYSRLARGGPTRADGVQACGMMGT